MSGHSETQRFRPVTGLSAPGRRARAAGRCMVVPFTYLRTLKSQMAAAFLFNDRDLEEIT